MASVQPFLDRVIHWAASRGDIRAVALVGSYARGNARADSDIDLVLLTTAREAYLAHYAWLDTFGAVAHVEREDWGKVVALRVWYRDGPEVEFGLATPDWAAPPLDAGTARVVDDGIIRLYDPDELLLFST